MTQRLITVFLVVALLLCVLLGLMRHGHAHMHDRADLNTWFNELASGKGLCCSFAEGKKVEDVDWDSGGPMNCVMVGTEQQCHSTYRVYLNGKWINVPDNALVTVPNKYGQAVVWPYTDSDGATQIRCF